MPCGGRCGRRRSRTSVRPEPRHWRDPPTGRRSRCFEQALTALGHLPETRETLEQAIDLRFDLRTVTLPARRIRADLRLSPRSRRPGEDARRSTATRAAVRLYVPQPLDDWSSDGSARVRPDRPGHCRVARGCSAPGDGNLYFGVACIWTGDYRRAEDLLLKVLQLLEGDLSRERFGLAGFPAVMARCYLTWVFADQGKFRKGSSTARKASASLRRWITPTAWPSCAGFSPISISPGENSATPSACSNAGWRWSRVEPDLLFSAPHGEPGLRLRALGADC